MYQLLVPKVGGNNLPQVVKPQGRFRIPRDNTHRYSAMKDGLCGSLNSTYKGRLLPAAPRTDPYVTNYVIRLLRQVKRSRTFRYQS